MFYYRTVNAPAHTGSLCRYIAGKVGQWLFHSSSWVCEGLQISYDYLCRRWYIQEQLTHHWNYYWTPFWFYYWNPFWLLRPCPCWFWQAVWDWRYRVNFYTGCATQRWGFGTATQVWLSKRLIKSIHLHDRLTTKFGTSFNCSFIDPLYMESCCDTRPIIVKIHAGMTVFRLSGPSAPKMFGGLALPVV